MDFFYFGYQKVGPFEYRAQFSNMAFETHLVYNEFRAIIDTQLFGGEKVACKSHEKEAQFFVDLCGPLR
jgi:hypothetical protein